MNLPQIRSPIAKLLIHSGEKMIVFFSLYFDLNGIINAKIKKNGNYEGVKRLFFHFI